MATKTISRCATCGYPLAASYEGQTVTCPNCHTINQAISSGLTVPWTLVTFGLGVVIGPILLGSTRAGQAWLNRQVSRKLGG